LSESDRFRASAVAALTLWDKWSALSGPAQSASAPSLLELQTICRQTHCTLPELEGFAQLKGRKPALLLCGGDNALAEQMAALLGYDIAFPQIPDSAVVWGVDAGKESVVRLRHGSDEQVISRTGVLDYLGGDAPSDDWYIVDERVPGSGTWRFLWMPFPGYFHAENCRPSDFEMVMSQNAAVVVTEVTPVPLQKMLEEIGQKYWPISENDLSTSEERTRLMRDLSVLWDHRPQDLNVGRAAAWNWFVVRLTERIVIRRREFQQALNQQEIKIASTRHLLTQYKKNMTNGVRTMVETYLQNRVASQAFTAFYDSGKGGPQTDSFLSAVGLPSLWTKVDEYVTDRMADFVTGLTGLAAKLDLPRITLGEANARWASRSLNSRLEAALNEKRIFPEGGGKRGGLVGNLTGRKQAVVDDRKAQVLKAARILVQFIELEFQAWCTQFMNTVESGVVVRLATALAGQGMPDMDTIRSTIDGLTRMEQLLTGEAAGAESSPPPASIEWMASLTERRWIPLYHTPG
jgi:hypothetical protein